MFLLISHPTPALIADDDGREVRRVHLDVAEERDSGNTEEEQLGVVVRGTLPQRLHNGAAQARRASVQRAEGGGDAAPAAEGPGGRDARPQQQLPADAEPGVDRPPNIDGDDPRHPDVHGPRLRPTERRRECVQPRAHHLPRRDRPERADPQPSARDAPHDGDERAKGRSHRSHPHQERVSDAHGARHQQPLGLRAGLRASIPHTISGLLHNGISEVPVGKQRQRVHQARRGAHHRGGGAREALLGREHRAAHR